MQKSGYQIKKRDPQSPLTFRESFYSDGILCDVNILFNAMKVPHEDDPSRSPKENAGKRCSRSSKLAEAMKLCLADVLNSFSKEELTNYTVLLNSCPLNGLNDLEHSSMDRDENHPGPNTNTKENSCTPPPFINQNCPPRPTKPNRKCFNESYQRRGGNSGCCSESSASTNKKGCGAFLTRSDPPKTNVKEESNFNRILRLLDVLCELRPLMDRPNSRGAVVKEGEENDGSSHPNAQRRLFCRETSLPNDEFVS